MFSLRDEYVPGVKCKIKYSSAFAFYGVAERSLGEGAVERRTLSGRFGVPGLVVEQDLGILGTHVAGVATDGVLVILIRKGRERTMATGNL